MAVITPTIETGGCFCGSVVTTDCAGNLICQDFCDLVRACPAFNGRLRFFGDLLDTPSTCQPNKLLGTDASCGGVILLDPCAVLAGCGIADVKVKASGSDLTAGFLGDKLGICPASSSYLTLISDGNFANEKLLLCLTNPPVRLIDTSDGPGARPNCAGLGRPVIQGNASSATGRVATCPVQRAIGRITLDTSYQEQVPNSTTGFFIPNGTRVFSGVGITTTFATLGGNTGTGAVMIAPRDGWYMVGMKGCSNVGQGVHTVRYQTVKYDSTYTSYVIVLDDRFEGPIFSDAAHANAYANDAFDSGLIPGPGVFLSNMVRGLFGYGFGQSKPFFMTAGERIVFVTKYSTVVNGETHTATPKISINGTSDAGMTNGESVGTEIWMVELDQTFYPV